MTAVKGMERSGKDVTAEVAGDECVLGKIVVCPSE
jgi:hypothetical protein